MVQAKSIDDPVTTRVAVDRLKYIIERHKEETIFDYHVADLLRISKDVLATSIHRNVSISDHVLKLCARTGLDPMKLLF